MRMMPRMKRKSDRVSTLVPRFFALFFRVFFFAVFFFTVLPLVFADRSARRRAEKNLQRS